MILEILLILIQAIIAILSLLFDVKEKNLIKWILFSLVIVIAIIELCFTWQNEKKEKLNIFSGSLSGQREFYPTGTNKYPRLKMGDSEAYMEWKGDQGKELINFFDEYGLKIRILNGKLLVSTLVKDREGKIIAQIEDNNWRIIPSKIFDRNYNDTALEIMDDYGDIVLQLILIDSRTVQMQGKFYGINGRGIAIGSEVNNKEIEGVFEILGSNHKKFDINIEPIFKYPSSIEENSGKLK